MENLKRGRTTTCATMHPADSKVYVDPDLWLSRYSSRSDWLMWINCSPSWRPVCVCIVRSAVAWNGGLAKCVYVYVFVVFHACMRKCVTSLAVPFFLIYPTARSYCFFPATSLFFLFSSVLWNERDYISSCPLKSLIIQAFWDPFSLIDEPNGLALWPSMHIF